MGVFRRQLIGGYERFFAALPEACFENLSKEDTPFTVPLASLLEQPAEAIENLILSFYDDDVFRYDLFHDLRERLAGNLVIASGFSPETNPHDVTDRLIMPTRHKCRDGVELARLYLRGTPFEDLFELPMPFRVRKPYSLSTATSSAARATARRSSSSA